MLGGAVKGVGKQTEGSICNFVSYYVVGMLAAFSLSLILNMQVKGLWLGLQAGSVMSCLLYALVIYNLDWNYII